MGKGQTLWRRAKQVIPGGNMLLSKRPEMFLPEHWPAYFSEAKGCMIRDPDPGHGRRDERLLLDDVQAAMANGNPAQGRADRWLTWARMSAESNA